MNYPPVDYPTRTVGIPLSTDEWNCFNSILKNAGLKKGFYLRKLILDELERRGWKFPREI